MWPWGHLAVGYLLYAGLARFQCGEQPTATTAVAVALGTQFPDLIDKPLAWSFELLPNGRSLAHSAVIGLVLVGGLLFVASRLERSDAGVAFGVGYVSHFVGDALYPALDGQLYELGFLLWPILPPIEYSTEQSFVAHLAQLNFGPTFWFEIGLFLLASLVWYADGSPGLPRRSWLKNSEQTGPEEYDD